MMRHAWRRDHRARMYARGFRPFNVVWWLSAARDNRTSMIVHTVSCRNPTVVSPYRVHTEDQSALG